MADTDHHVTELVEKARAGNRASLGQLVDRFHKDVFRMVYYRIYSPMDAEDLTQEIFMQMSKSLSSLKDAGSIRPWLFRIALNRVRDFRRKKSILSFFDTTIELELPLIYRGTPTGERRACALRALEAVGLKGWETHTPSELSGGQQQRVAIARAIVANPKVLLADEPTGNLDSARSREIMEVLAAFNSERGITIALVTHDADMATYAKRIIHFLDGIIDTEEQNGGIA